MDKILVTGGAGMIGSRLVKKLVESGEDVYVIDNLFRGSLDNLCYNGKPIIDLKDKFFKLDLRDYSQLEKINQNFKYVYHLADIVAGIGYVFNNQLSIFRDNLLINTNVVEYVKKSRPKGYIYVGTACSFPAHLQDGTYTEGLVESDQYPASPESAYGWSKLMGEYESFLLEKEHNIPVSVLSLHNVYGAPCDYSLERSQVIPALIRKAITAKNGGQLDVWGSGKQGRAFVHVADVVDALSSARFGGLGQGLIQIGPDKCTSIKEISEIIVAIADKNLKINFDVSKPEGDHSRFANFSKARDILNWEPRVKINDGLKEVFDWINEKISKNIG